MATLTKEQITSLLGRPLTEVEEANFELYLNIAKLRLEDLTCTDLDSLEELPDDLALVWARLFGGTSSEQQSNGGVASKRVEDFQITYREGYDPLAELITQNGATLAKYSECSNGIRHGNTIYDAGYRHNDCV